MNNKKNNVLNTEMKKGDPECLDGQVTVYAKIDIDPSELLSMKHPVASMIHGGIIAVQGNYREQSSLRDFLRNEMGISLDGNNEFGDNGEDDLRELLEEQGGIEAALDPKKLREKLEHIEDIEDFIPTPAKVVPFHTEQEILTQPGDVYFAGFYKKIGNAVLGINAVPIIYQALFREQQMQTLQNEIESLISNIEFGGGETEPAVTVTSPGVDPEELLIKEYIPTMIYQRVDSKAFAIAQRQFRAFMRGYRFKGDIEEIISLITEDHANKNAEYKLLELYAKKISLVLREDFSGAEAVKKGIEKVKGEMI